MWFEAWRYQHEERPVIALLHEIRQQLALWQKGLRGLKKINEVLIRGALTIFDESTKQVGVTGLSKIQEIGETYESKHLETLLGVEQVRLHLQQAIDSLLLNGLQKGPNRRLVVLIDDLDRCHPVAAAKLLEGLKIFLNLDNCVFVLGMNQQIIEHGIALSYKDLLKDFQVDHRAIAREYLEKICQNILHLPLPANSAEFLKRALARISAATPLSSNASGRDDFFASVVEVLNQENYVAPNPRRVKLFANLLERMFEHHLHIYTGAERTRNAQIAIVFGFLYLSDQPVFRILQTQRSFYNEVLLPWARNPKDPNLATFKAVQGLRPTLQSAVNDLSPTSTVALSNAYPDPSEEGVMRVQPLIVDLEELENEEIGRYLLQ